MRYYEQYIEDLATLTGLPINIIRDLMKKFRLIVGNELYECMISDRDMESRCLGIGKLKVEVDNTTDSYNISFTLSKDMKKIIDNMMESQTSPIVEKFEEDLVKKITELYKKELY